MHVGMSFTCEKDVGVKHMSSRKRKALDEYDVSEVAESGGVLSVG